MLFWVEDTYQIKDLETPEKPERFPVLSGRERCMPKKATTARNGVQRTKPKTQKSFELVRPVSEIQEREAEEITTTEEHTVAESPSVASSAIETSAELATLPTVPKKKARSSSIATEVTPVETVTSKAPEAVETLATAPKGSASARLAARKNTQRSQRNAASLITAEHYSYVRRDLAFIAVLAAVMFIAIIVLYFIPGIGA